MSKNRKPLTKIYGEFLEEIEYVSLNNHNDVDEVYGGIYKDKDCIRIYLQFIYNGFLYEETINCNILRIEDELRPFMGGLFLEKFIRMVKINEKLTKQKIYRKYNDFLDEMMG